MKRPLVAALATVTLNGCGLIFLGLNQDVRVLTDPAGAVATLDDETLQTPAIFEVRRDTGWRVLRAELPGHGPACAVLRCPKNKAVVTFDVLALLLPYVVDDVLGTQRRCPQPGLLKLPALAEGAPTYKLPDDAVLIQAARAGSDICAVPYQYDEVFLGHAQRIMVTAGPLSVDYEPVGTVDVVLPGFDRTRTVSTSTAYGFGIATSSGQTHREFRQADTSQANNALRAEALMRYGKRVDAVINVEYMTNPKNDVNATGLAVRLVGKEQ